MNLARNPGVLWIVLMLMLPGVEGLAMSPDNPSQNPASAEPPKILFVYREFWKEGTQSDLNRIEFDAARMCIKLGCPHPYLALESITGSKEVWYLNGFRSDEEQERVREEYRKKDLFATMSRFNQQRAPFESEPGKESYSNYRPDLSSGVPWSMGRGRFLVIAIAEGERKSRGTVFATKEAIRFVVVPAQTRTEADAKLSSAGRGAKIFAVRPHFSMAAAEWVAADADFWSASASTK